MGVYKNIYYNDFASTASLLKNSLLLKLSLKEWEELLTLKNIFVPSETLKEVAIYLIGLYNTGVFYYKDNSYWFDKTMRSSLKSLVNSNPETITLVLGSEFVELPTEKVGNFLDLLEIYAAQCYVTKLKHILAINNLKTTEEIANYDYTKGFPEKVILNE